MDKSLLPFICISGIVAIIGVKSPVSNPPINYSTSPHPLIQPYYNPVADVVAPAASALEPGAEAIAHQLLLRSSSFRGINSQRPYQNGYASHNGTLIGDMVHQMSAEGKIGAETLDYANDVVSRCAALSPPKPPICN